MWWPFTDLGPKASPAPNLLGAIIVATPTPSPRLRIYHYDAVCLNGRLGRRVTLIFDNDRHIIKVFPAGVCGWPAVISEAK